MQKVLGKMENNSYYYNQVTSKDIYPYLEVMYERVHSATDDREVY